MTKMHWRALLPGKEQRFDVTELWISPVQKICPQFVPQLKIEKLELCLQELSLEAPKRHESLRKINIPSLYDLTGNTSPRLVDLLKQQGESDIAAAIANKNPIILGLRIPRDRFVENIFGAKSYQLVLSQIVDGRICYLGRCRYATDFNSIPGEHFPLFLDDNQGIQGLSHKDTGSTQDFVDLWILADTRISPNALNFSYGIFVASGESIRKADSILKPIMAASWIGNGAILLGIALMAFLTSAIWLRYLDFAAFAVLAAVQFEVATQNTLLLLTDNLSNWLRYDVTLLMLRLILSTVASIFFAISTLRPEPHKFWRQWLGTTLGISCVGLALGMFKTGVFSKSNLWMVSACVRMFVPTAIVILGGLKVKQTLHDQLGNNHASWSTADRRFREQLIIAFCLFFQAIPDMMFALGSTHGTYIYDVREFSGIFLFPLFGALIYSAGGKFKSEADAYRKDLEMTSRKAALVEAVQMLAHDIRKPFSLLRVGLQMLQKVKHIHDIESVITKLDPQISRSLASVNNMLEDVMAINAKDSLTLETVSLESMILRCLHDSFAAWPHANVDFIYHLSQKSNIRVDIAKMSRVINNIIFNALEATHGKCSFIFGSEETHKLGRKNFVLTIRNTGSYISEDIIEKIFESFFTKGKLGGTGLGLAVAKKFTNLHGGTIHCHSDRQNGTEFTLELPLEEQNETYTPVLLPLSSKEIRQQTGNFDGLSSAGANESVLPKNFVLIVDDDPFIQEAWASSLYPTASIALDSVSSVDLWLEKNAQKITQISIVILDYYFHGSPDGLKVARTLRAQLPPSVKIFLSTDACNIATDGSGIDAVIAKTPISIVELLAIMQTTSTAV